MHKLFNHILGETETDEMNLDDTRGFKVSGNVIQLHGLEQGLDLIVFNARRVYNIKVSSPSPMPSSYSSTSAIISMMLTRSLLSSASLLSYFIWLILSFQGAEREGIVRLSVTDLKSYTTNVFLHPEIAKKFSFSQSKAYAVRFAIICFPISVLLLQLVVSFCCCWSSQLSHRFKHTSIFEKATHVLGVVDFLVIKTLAIDWKVEVKGWI